LTWNCELISDWLQYEGDHLESLYCMLKANSELSFWSVEIVKYPC